MQEKVESILKAIEELDQELEGGGSKYALTFSLFTKEGGRIASIYQCTGDQELLFQSIEHMADLANDKE